MPSAGELEDLFAEGRLGDMLLAAFGGERGHTEPLKDSDFMIGFESAAKTPSIDLIRSKVVEFYQKLGYVVEENEAFSGADNLTVVVHHDRDKISWHAFVVTITTDYPIAPGEKRSYLRASSLRV